MAHLIDKDALVEEIERYKKEEGWCQVGKDTADVYYARGFRFACERIISYLETIEVKEADLEKEIEEHVIGMPMSEFTHESEVEEFYKWARGEFKHFFELGLKAQQEPVNEDLEKAAEDWDKSLYRSDAFKAGANWQKAQDVKLIFNAKDDGYRLGLATMKQQMMEDAVDAKVCNKAYPTKFEVETNTFIQKLNHGDNVKLIIINED